MAHSPRHRGLLVGLLTLASFSSGAVAIAAHSAPSSTPATGSAATAPIVASADAAGGAASVQQGDGDAGRTFVVHQDDHGSHGR